VLEDDPEYQRHEAVLVSYLPLCHVAEQIFTNFVTLAVGGTAWFCPELTEVKDYLLAARPTVQPQRTRQPPRATQRAPGLSHGPAQS